MKEAGKVLVDRSSGERSVFRWPSWTGLAVCAIVSGLAFVTALAFSQSASREIIPVASDLLDQLNQEIGEGADGAETASTLPAKRLIGHGDVLGSPADLVVFKERIAILDSRPLQGEGQLLVLDRRTGRIVESAGPEGQGPTDLFRPNALQAARTEMPKVWVNDYPNARLVLYSLGSLSEGPEETISKPDSWIHQFAWLDDESFVGGGLFVMELLRQYQVNASQVAVLSRTIGTPLLADVPPAVATQLNRGAIASAPDGGRFVLAFLYVNRLYFYDRHGSLERSIAGPAEVVPAYTYEGDVFRLDPTKGRFAYRDVATTNDCVVALFSGKSDKAAGTALHVFAWDGKLQRVWTVADELGWIAMDAMSDAVFGVRWEPEPAIVEYGPVCRPAAPGERR